METFEIEVFVDLIIRLINHVTKLVEEGTDVIAISTAHGYTANVGEAIYYIRQESFVTLRD